MNAELKSLYEKAGKIDAQMRDVYRLVKERNGIATDEENRQFDAWDKEIEQVNAQIEFIKRGEQLSAREEVARGVRFESSDNKEKKYNEKATRIERRNAMDKAKKVGYSSLTDEERSIVDTENRDCEVYEKYLRFGVTSLDAEEKRVLNQYRNAEQRTQSKASNAAGLYTVPEGFSGYVIESLAYISALTSWANIIRTDTGIDIPFPTNDDTSNTGELIGENSDLSSSSADLVFGVKTLKAYKFSSKMVKVSSELLQDNGVNLAQYLGRQLGNRLARVSNSYWTTGTGSSQPQGYITGASQGLVTASASAFTSAELIEFQDTLDVAYQQGPKVAWAMHQNILSEIKRLTIGSNYNSQLWVPSFRDGAPATILGKPYFLNNAMASSLATGAKVIAYGDFERFTIRMINDLMMKRLEERYAEYDVTAFFGLMRHDSFVEDSAAIEYLEMT